mmetsp:Transcript_35379/g.67675  ORF Transcript_35379/g.67675 Transcript_35379/m.67675 type:complete len:331 (+) Transcript_35379:214-1206(+)
MEMTRGYYRANLVLLLLLISIRYALTDLTSSLGPSLLPDLLKVGATQHHNYKAAAASSPLHEAGAHTATRTRLSHANYSVSRAPLSSKRDMTRIEFPGLNVTVKSHDPTSIVLVANGKTVLNTRKGSAVDGHELVGRFNYFKTAGFEQDVGKRVDLWFLGELKEPGPRGTRGRLGAKSGTMNLKTQPSQNYVVPIVYPTSNACMKKRSVKTCAPSKSDAKYRKSTVALLQKAYSKYKIGDLLEFMPVSIEQLLQVKYNYVERWPSSGLLALVYCLEVYPKSTISIHGFDFGTRGLGHYWEKFLKSTTVHSMRKEGQLLNSLIKSGRVKHL